MPRPSLLTIAPEDKRNVTVTLKLTAEENELLTKYAESLDSDKSYVAGKIFMAFINQVLKPVAATPEEVPAPKAGAAKKPHAVAPTA